MTFHPPTAFFIIGLLYIFLPLLAWLSLKHLASKTVLLWCLGGGILAMGMLLIAARGQIPAWLTFTAANTLAWIGILMQAMALRHALQKPWNSMWLGVLIAAWVLIFEYFRLVLGSAQYRFAWAILLYLLLFFYIAYLAWKISIRNGLQTGKWLALVYVFAAISLFARAFRGVMGWSAPDVVASGADSALTVLNGLLISVIGTFTFVSMFLERAFNNEIAEAEQRVREEESRRLSEQIAQLERQRTLGEMSYSFAHELSQPLTAILMDTHAIKSSLQMSPIDVKDIADSVNDVERSATRTVQLIERIRSFIRPTKNEKSDVDMKAMVQDVQYLLMHEIRVHVVKFEWDFDDASCVVQGDKVQLSQIVLNVYRNAIQAMAASPIRIIDVSLTRDDDRVVLRVHDTGSGLSEAIKDKVGEPFVTTKKDGLGVGFSISKTIAEMHSGSLTITNAVGGGALVELNLPAAAD